MLRTQQWPRLMKTSISQSRKLVLATAAQTCIDLHVADRVTSQEEDPILKTVIKWISNWKYRI